MKQANLKDLFRKESTKKTNPEANSLNLNKVDDKKNENKPNITEIIMQNSNSQQDKEIPGLISKKRKLHVIESDEEKEPMIITTTAPLNGNSGSTESKTVGNIQMTNGNNENETQKSISTTNENISVQSIELSLKKLKTSTPKPTPVSSTPGKTSQTIKMPTLVLPHEIKLKDTTNLIPIHYKKYNAYHDAPFYEGHHVPFSFLVDCFEYVSSIKGENSKEHIKEVISNMLRSIYLLKPDELVDAYYFCILKIAPDYIENNELGIGNEIIIKAISKTCGRTEKQIRDSMNQLGDLGKVASQSKASQSTMDKFFKKSVEQKKSTLTLCRVMDTFRKIATTKGMNSANEKESMLMKLLFDSKGEEAKYIVRWIQKNLKIGAAEASMQSALVRAFVLAIYVNEKDKIGKPDLNAVPDLNGKLAKHDEITKRAICEYPDYGAVINYMMAVEKDIEKLLDYCKITPGVPVKPMLAKPCKEIGIILKRFEGIKFSCEWKYDGLRGQIHYHNGKCDIFSRNLENMTQTYPDILEFIMTHTKPNIKNFIIDSEIVAIDAATEKILPFQTLSTRSRKNVDKNQIEIEVCIFVFDILYLNDQSLLQEPLSKRRELLKSSIEESGEKLRYAAHLDTESFEEIEDFLNQSVKVGCEGLMIKTLDINSTYEPSKRSFKWLKLKKDYLETGLGDSFDLVPIGAYWGTGKRAGVYGSYLLASWNDEMERFETLCKTATGFSDENLQKFHQILSEHVIPAPLQEYKLKEKDCDVWFEPSIVWEVKGADIQVSPIYTCSIGDIDQNKGVGMRFPRLVKIRPDKKPRDATTSAFIAEIYRNQAAVMNKVDIKDEEDFY